MDKRIELLTRREGYVMRKVWLSFFMAIAIVLGCGSVHPAEAMTQVYDAKGMRATVDETSIVWRQDDSSRRDFAVIVYEWDKYCLYEFRTDSYGRWLCTINSTTTCSPRDRAYVEAVLQFCVNYTGRPYCR